MTFIAFSQLSVFENTPSHIMQVHDEIFPDSFPASSSLISLNLFRAQCTFSSLLHNLVLTNPMASAANTFGSNSTSIKCLCKDLALLNAILILPGSVLYNGT